MNIEELRAYCIGKKRVSESFPFDSSTLVFKVMGKMFALANVDHFQSINLKCNPEKALELRAEYPGITPGYHMNKKYWNSVAVDGSVPVSLLYELIDHSYNEVVQKLTKAEKAELAQS